MSNSDILIDLLAFDLKHNKDILPSEEVLKQREKSRKNTYSWREKNREEYNAYMLPLAKAYYLKNKERVNKLRTVRNQKKREKERLESLGQNL